MEAIWQMPVQTKMMFQGTEALGSVPYTIRPASNVGEHDVLLCSDATYSFAHVYVNNGGNNNQAHAIIFPDEKEYRVRLFSLAYSVNASPDLIFTWRSNAIYARTSNGVYSLNFYIQLFI